MISSISSNNPGAFHPVLQIVLVQNSWIYSVPKHQRRPLPFSSVFIFILWLQSYLEGLRPLPPDPLPLLLTQLLACAVGAGAAGHPALRTDAPLPCLIPHWGAPGADGGAAAEAADAGTADVDALLADAGGGMAAAAAQLTHLAAVGGACAVCRHHFRLRLTSQFCDRQHLCLTRFLKRQIRRDISFPRMYDNFKLYCRLQSQWRQEESFNVCNWVLPKPQN